MKFEWDPAKNTTNRQKHGVGFEEAVRVFEAVDCTLELFDELHADREDRFISTGPVDDRLDFRSLGDGKRKANARQLHGAKAMTDEFTELTEQDFERTLLRAQRQRLISGEIQSGQDVADLRKFVGLTQVEFSAALGISVRTLQGWEQGRRRPEGPALALLRIAARHPRIIRENVASAA